MSRLRRRVLGLACVALGALLIWKGTAELIEPHFLLWLQPRLPFLDAPAVAGTSFRLYGDTRPHVGKIAGLQKGLVWMRGRRSLAEEGYGFGCPIVAFEGQAYVSRRAEVERVALGEGSYRLIKRFEMDTVDTPIQFLRRKYRPVPSLGVVACQYDIHPQGVIDVTVDLSGLDVPWSRVYLMNEQGAQHFDRYHDSQGRSLAAEQIGIWEQSATWIERACFDSPRDGLRFCVEPQPPAGVYYGRERYNQYNWRGIFYLSWSGVDLELSAGAPPTYRYRIALEAL